MKIVAVAIILEELVLCRWFPTLKFTTIDLLLNTAFLTGACLLGLQTLPTQDLVMSEFCPLWKLAPLIGMEEMKMENLTLQGYIYTVWK